MDTFPDSSRDVPSTTGFLRPAEEARLFEEIIRAHPHLPEGVHGITFRMGLDYAGTPAGGFILKADDDLNPSDEKIDALNRFEKVLRHAVYLSDSDRLPYMRVETE